MLFPSLPDAARVWTFVADAPLDDRTKSALLDTLRPFLAGWASHGRPVQAEATVVHDRALLVAALIDEDAFNAGVSGCGIDAMRHAVEAALDGHGVRTVSPLAVVVEGASGWEVLTRAQARARAAEGSLHTDTRVLDVTRERLGDLRDGPARRADETWVGRAFSLPAAA